MNRKRKTGLNFRFRTVNGRKARPRSRCARHAREGTGDTAAPPFRSRKDALPVPRREDAGAKGTGNRASNYWSSSTNVDNADNAWNVNFNNGNVNNNNKTNDNYVRCVADGAWL